MYRPLDRGALLQRLRRHLAIHGPAPAAELYRVLDCSAATLSRLFAESRDEYVAAGRGKARQYALRREVLGTSDGIPVHEVSADGATALLGLLHPVAPAGFWFESGTSLEGFYDGLPWFLEDLRPAGFLGRLVPRRHPELGFPSDVRDWSNEQTLAWLRDHGVDLVGNLVVGAEAFRRLLVATPPNEVAATERAARYTELARDVMSAGGAGSSAGGEQPKFLATVREGEGATPVLVKFSPPVATPHGERVADLLVCEHVASTHLAGAGLDLARTRIVRTGERVFLEVERFDRVGESGRRGLVSLRALDGQFVGHGQAWAVVAERLHGQRRIATACLDRVRWLERFGAWIGNTDRHLGNLSFRFDGGALGALAPVYDMLPMAYAPRAGEVVPVDVSWPQLDAAHPRAWIETWRAGLAFWREVTGRADISADFRAIAARNAAHLEGLDRMIRRLPA